MAGGRRGDVTALGEARCCGFDVSRVDGVDVSGTSRLGDTQAMEYTV